MLIDVHGRIFSGLFYVDILCSGYLPFAGQQAQEYRQV